MKQLTPQERDALMADLRAFFESDTEDEIVSDDERIDNEVLDFDR